MLARMIPIGYENRNAAKKFEVILDYAAGYFYYKDSNGVVIPVKTAEYDFLHYTKLHNNRVIDSKYNDYLSGEVFAGTTYHSYDTGKEDRYMIMDTSVPLRDFINGEVDRIAAHIIMNDYAFTGSREISARPFIIEPITNTDNVYRAMPAGSKKVAKKLTTIIDEMLTSIIELGNTFSNYYTSMQVDNIVAALLPMGSIDKTKYGTAAKIVDVIVADIKNLADNYTANGGVIPAEFNSFLKTVNILDTLRSAFNQYKIDAAAEFLSKSLAQNTYATLTTTQSLSSAISNLESALTGYLSLGVTLPTGYKTAAEIVSKLRSLETSLGNTTEVANSAKGIADAAMPKGETSYASAEEMMNDLVIKGAGYEANKYPNMKSITDAIEASGTKSELVAKCVGKQWGMVRGYIDDDNWDQAGNIWNVSMGDKIYGSQLKADAGHGVGQFDIKQHYGGSRITLGRDVMRVNTFNINDVMFRSYPTSTSTSNDVYVAGPNGLAGDYDDFGSGNGWSHLTLMNNKFSRFYYTLTADWASNPDIYYLGRGSAFDGGNAARNNLIGNLPIVESDILYPDAIVAAAPADVGVGLMTNSSAREVCWPGDTGFYIPTLKTRNYFFQSLMTRGKNILFRMPIADKESSNGLYVTVSFVSGAWTGTVIGAFSTVSGVVLATVKDINGNRVPNVRVAITVGGNTFHSTGVTNANGEVTIEWSYSNNTSNSGLSVGSFTGIAGIDLLISEGAPPTTTLAPSATASGRAIVVVSPNAAGISIPVGTPIILIVNVNGEAREFTTNYTGGGTVGIDWSVINNISPGPIPVAGGSARTGATIVDTVPAVVASIPLPTPPESFSFIEFAETIEVPEGMIGVDGRPLWFTLTKYNTGEIVVGCADLTLQTVGVTGSIYGPAIEKLVYVGRGYRYDDTYYWLGVDLYYYNSTTNMISKKTLVVSFNGDLENGITSVVLEIVDVKSFPSPIPFALPYGCTTPIRMNRQFDGSILIINKLMSNPYDMCIDEPGFKIDYKDKQTRVYKVALNYF